MPRGWLLVTLALTALWLAPGGAGEQSPEWERSGSAALAGGADGFATLAGGNLTWHTAGGDPVWWASAPDGALALAGDRLAAWNGSALEVRALNGTLLWNHSGDLVAVTLTPERLYLRDNATLRALAAADGDEAWNTTLAGEPFPAGEGLLLQNATRLVMLSGNGTVAWQRNLTGAGWVADASLITGIVAENLTVLDADGAWLWNASGAGALALDGERLYRLGNGTLAAFHRNGSAAWNATAAGPNLTLAAGYLAAWGPEGFALFHDASGWQRLAATWDPARLVASSSRLVAANATALRGWNRTVTLAVGDGGFASLAAALALAEPGDTLAIGNGSFDDDLDLNFTLTLRGSGNATLLTGRLDVHGSQVRLRDFWLDGDGNWTGAGLVARRVEVTGNLTATGTVLVNCTFRQAALALTGGRIAGGSFRGGSLAVDGSEVLDLTLNGTALTGRGNFSRLNATGGSLALAGPGAIDNATFTALLFEAVGGNLSLTDSRFTAVNLSFTRQNLTFRNLTGAGTWSANASRGSVAGLDLTGTMRLSEGDWTLRDLVVHGELAAEAASLDAAGLTADELRLEGSHGELTEVAAGNITIDGGNWTLAGTAAEGNLSLANATVAGTNLTAGRLLLAQAHLTASGVVAGGLVATGSDASLDRFNLTGDLASEGSNWTLVNATVTGSASFSDATLTARNLTAGRLLLAQAHLTASGVVAGGLIATGSDASLDGLNLTGDLASEGGNWTLVNATVTGSASFSDARLTARNLSIISASTALALAGGSGHSLVDVTLAGDIALRVVGASQVALVDATVTGGHRGLLFEYSSGLTSNATRFSGAVAAELRNASAATFNGGSLNGTATALWLRASENVTLDGVALNASAPLQLNGTLRRHFDHTLENTTANGLPAVLLHDPVGNLSLAGTGWAGLVGGRDLALAGLALGGSPEALLLAFSDGVRITDSTLSGLRAVGSSGLWLQNVSLATPLRLNASVGWLIESPWPGVVGDSASRLYGAAYLTVELRSTEGDPVPDGEVRVTDGGDVLYATPGYDGDDARTGDDGRIGPLLVVDRHFAGQVRDNFTGINVTFGSLNYSRVVSMATSHVELFEMLLPVENLDTGRVYGTVQDAVDFAAPGERVRLANETYFEHLRIDRPLTLLGWSAAQSVIDGSDTGTVALVSSDGVRLHNLTLRNGSTLLSVSGQATLADLTLADGTTGLVVTGTADGERIVFEDLSIGVFTSGSLALGNASFNWSTIGLQVTAGNTRLYYATLSNASLALRLDGGDARLAQLLVRDSTEGVRGGPGLLRDSRFVNCTTALNLTGPLEVRNVTITGSATGVWIGGANAIIAESNVTAGVALQIDDGAATVSDSRFAGATALLAQGSGAALLTNNTFVGPALVSDASRLLANFFDNLTLAQSDATLDGGLLETLNVSGGRPVVGNFTAGAIVIGGGARATLYNWGGVTPLVVDASLEWHIDRDLALADLAWNFSGNLTLLATGALTLTDPALALERVTVHGILNITGGSLAVTTLLIDGGGVALANLTINATGPALEFRAAGASVVRNSTLNAAAGPAVVARGYGLGTDGWRGEYFATPPGGAVAFGEPVLARHDATLDFNWGSGSPDPAVPADNFQARWSGVITTGSGTQWLRVTGEGGIRLSLDGEELFSQWSDGPVSRVLNRNPGAGEHHLLLEFHDQSGSARVRLERFVFGTGWVTLAARDYAALRLLDNTYSSELDLAGSFNVEVRGGTLPAVNLTGATRATLADLAVPTVAAADTRLVALANLTTGHVDGARSHGLHMLGSTLGVVVLDGASAASLWDNRVAELAFADGSGDIFAGFFYTNFTGNATLVTLDDTSRTLWHGNLLRDATLGLAMRGGGDHLFHANRFENLTVGLDFEESDNLEFNSNRFENLTVGLDFKESDDLEFNSNRFANSTLGVRFNGSHNAHFEYDRFADHYRAVEASNSSWNIDLEGVTIERCDDGVVLAGDDHSLADSTLRQAPLLLEGMGHRLTDNTIIGGIIRLRGDYAVIANNTLTGSPGTGLVVAGDFHEISNNTLAGHAGTGLAYDGNYSNIIDNDLTGNGGHGLYLGNGSGTWVSDNTLADNGGWQLYLLAPRTTAQRLDYRNNVSGGYLPYFYLADNATIENANLSAALRRFNGPAIVRDSHDIVLRNLTVSGWAQGIWVANASAVTLTGFDLHANGWGAWLENASAVELRDGFLANNSQGGLAGYRLDGLVLRDLAFRDNPVGVRLTEAPDSQLLALDLSGYASGIVIDASPRAWLEDLVLAGGSVGIELTDSDDSVLHDSTVSGTATGVQLVDCADANLANLRLEGGAHGLRVTGGSGELTANRVGNATLAGFRFVSTTVVLTNNRAWGSPYGLLAETTDLTASGDNLSANEIGLWAGNGSVALAATRTYANDHSGLVLHRATGRVADAAAVGNGRHGLVLSASTVTVSDGEFRGNGAAGILIDAEGGNTIARATLAGNRQGLLARGAANDEFYDLLVEHNDAGLRLENSTDLSVYGGTFTNNTVGLEVWFGSDLDLVAPTFSGGDFGVWLYRDHGTSVADATITAAEVGLRGRESNQTWVGGLTVRESREAGAWFNDAVGLMLSGGSLSGTATGIRLQASDAALADLSVAAGATGIHAAGDGYLTIDRVTTTGGERGLWLENLSGAVVRNTSFSGANVAGALLVGVVDAEFHDTTFAASNSSGLAVLAGSDGLVLRRPTFDANPTGLRLLGDDAAITRATFTGNGLGALLAGNRNTLTDSSFSDGALGLSVTGDDNSLEGNTHATDTALLVAGDDNWFGNETLADGDYGVRQTGGSGNRYHRLTASGFAAAGFAFEGGRASLTSSDASDNSGTGLRLAAAIAVSNSSFYRNTVGIRLEDDHDGVLADLNASANSAQGLLANGARGYTVRDSWFTANGDDGVLVAGGGITLLRCYTHANDGNGIHLSGSLRAAVRESAATGHRSSDGGYGLLLEDDRLTTLTGAHASGNLYGLLLNRSRSATLRDNVIADNDYQMGLAGTERDHFFHDLDGSNAIGGRPLLYLSNLTNASLTASFDPGFMAVVNSSDSLLEGYRVNGDIQGLVAAYNTNLTLRGLNLTGNLQGLWLQGGQRNHVVEGWFESNEVGLYAWLEDDLELSDSRFHANTHGALFRQSQAPLLVANRWTAHGLDALDLFETPGAVLRDSTLTGSGRNGVRLRRSGGATLENNTLAGNRYNLGVWGEPYGDFVETFANSTLVSGLPAVLLIGPRDTVYNASGNPGFFGVVGGYNITITGLDMAANGQGILLAHTTFSRVEDVTVRDNYYGLYLFRSHNNTLVNITASGNYRGIVLEQSQNNTLLMSAVTNNNDGVALLDSGGNLIEELGASGNANGLYLEGETQVQENELFNEPFDATLLNGSNWAASAAVAINAGHNNGVSYGLELAGNASLTSRTLNLSGSSDVHLSFSFEPGGSHDPPEDDDWLTLEYRLANASWQELWRRHGDSTRWPYYGYEYLALPPDAYHADFAFRFRSRGSGPGEDSFYLDDIRLAQVLVRGNTVVNSTLAGNTIGITIAGSDRNTLRNVTLTDNSNRGLLVTGDSRYNLIEESNLSLNLFGAEFGASTTYNLLRDSRLDDNTRDGLYLRGSYQQVYDNHLLRNGRYGIYVGSGQGSHLYNNLVNASGTYGIYLDNYQTNRQGLSWNNTVDGSPLRYYYNVHGTAAAPYVVGAINWTVYDTSINTGLVIRDSSNMLFTSNVLANQNRGIYIGGSSDIVLRDVVAYGNTVGDDPVGLYITASARITVDGLTLFANGLGAYVAGDVVTLRNGTFSGHGDDALVVAAGTGFVAQNLTFQDNQGREVVVTASAARLENLTLRDGHNLTAVLLAGSNNRLANVTLAASGEVVIAGTGQWIYALTSTDSFAAAALTVASNDSLLARVEVASDTLALNLTGAGNTLRDAMLRDATTGLRLAGSDNLAENVTLLRNALGALLEGYGVTFANGTVASCDVGLVLADGTATVRNTTFSSNTVGLRVTGDGHLVAGSGFTASPVEITGNATTLRNNTLVGSPLSLLGNATLVTGGSLAVSPAVDHGNASRFDAVAFGDTAGYALRLEGIGGEVRDSRFEGNGGGVWLAPWSRDYLLYGNAFANHTTTAVWLGGNGSVVENSTAAGNGIGLHVPLAGINAAYDNHWNLPVTYGVFIEAPLINNQSIATSNFVDGEALPWLIDLWGDPGGVFQPPAPVVIAGYDYTARPRLANFGLVVRGGGWLSLANNTFVGRDYGLWLDGATRVEIVDSSFSGTLAGVRVNGTALTLRNLTVSDSGAGVNLTGSDILLAGSNINNNTGHGVWVGGSAITLRDSLSGDNGGYGLYAPADGGNRYWNNTLRGNGLDLFLAQPYTTIEQLALNNTVGGHPVPWVSGYDGNWTIAGLDYDAQPTLVNFGVVIRNASQVRVRDSTVSDRAYGLFIDNAVVVLENLTLHDNGVAVEAREVTGTLGNATLTANGQGVRVGSGTLTVWNGHYRDNGQALNFSAGASGDWIVSNPHTSSLTNDTAWLRGDLMIAATGNLTLTNASLYLVAGSDGQYGITVADGGRLLVRDQAGVPDTSSLVSRGGVAAIYFVAEQGASLAVRNATLRGIGYVGGDSRHTALQIETPNAVVTESIIDGGYRGVLLTATGSGTFTNNTLVGRSQAGEGFLLAGASGVVLAENFIEGRNAAAIRLVGADGNLLRSNLLADNTRGIILEAGSDDNQLLDNSLARHTTYTLALSWSSRNLLANNTLTDGDEGLRIANGAGNRLLNNTIRNHGGNGLAALSSSPTLVGNRYLDNGLGLRLWYATATSRNGSLVGNGLDLDLTSSDAYLLNTTFGSLEIDATSTLAVANYLAVEVQHLTGRGVKGAEVLVTDNNRTVYATPFFSGANATTPASGRVAWIAVTDRIYRGSLLAEENFTWVEVRYFIWNASRAVNMSLSHTEVFVRPGLTVTVDDDGPADFATITEAAEVVLDGDTILVRNGTYTETVELVWAVRVVGEGASVVRAPGEVIFTLNTSHIVLENLILRDSALAINATNASYGRLVNLTFADNDLDILVANVSRDMVSLNSTGTLAVHGSLAERNYLAFEVHNRDYRYQPLHGVAWRLRNDNLTIAATPHYNGTAAPTGSTGRVAWLEAAYAFHYDDNVAYNQTWLALNYTTGNETRLVNMSASHTEFFTFDTERPRGVNLTAAAAVNRTLALTIWLNGSDREDPAWILAPQLEARFGVANGSGNWSGNWSGNASFTNATGWRLAWTPPADARLGNYTLRVRLQDPDRDNSSWRNLTVEVRDNWPVVTRLNFSAAWVNRTFSLNLSGGGYDVEDEQELLVPTFQHRAPNGNWSTDWFSNATFAAGQWNVTFTPPANATLGPYRLRFALTDRDANLTWRETAVEVRNNLPWAARLLLVGSHVYRTNTTLLAAPGSDIEDQPWSLVPRFEYQPPGGAWSDAWVADPLFNLSRGRWEANFTPAANATLGPYRFRVQLTDLDHGSSGWLDAPGRLWVRNNDPVVESLTFHRESIDRMRFMLFYGNGSDVENPPEQLWPEFEHRAPLAVDFNGDYFSNPRFRDGHWEVVFLPAPEAELGVYNFRARFRDSDGNYSRWVALEGGLDITNFMPELRNFWTERTSLERMTSLNLTLGAYDENPTALAVILRYWTPGGGWGEDTYLAGGAYNESRTRLEAGQLYSEWDYTFAPPADAELGNYTFRYWLEDDLGDGTGWLLLDETIEVRNYLPRVTGFRLGDRFLERLAATQVRFAPRDENLTNLTLQIEQRPNGTAAWKGGYFGPATYDPPNGSYSLLLQVPLKSRKGFHDVRLRLRDELGDWGPWHYVPRAFRVLNAPPQVEPLDNRIVLLGTPVELVTIASDWDGWIVFYEWDFDNDGVVDWRSNDTANLTYLYPAPGVYFPRLIVWDNDGNETVVMLTVQVKEPQPPAPPAPLSRTGLALLALALLVVFGGPFYLRRVQKAGARKGAPKGEAEEEDEVEEGLPEEPGPPEAEAEGEAEPEAEAEAEGEAEPEAEEEAEVEEGPPEAEGEPEGEEAPADTEGEVEEAPPEEETPADEGGLPEEAEPPEGDDAQPAD